MADEAAEPFDVRRFEELLTALQDAVQRGQEKMPPAEQMQLYNLVYQACSKRSASAAQLHKLAGGLIDTYLQEKVVPQIRNLRGAPLLRALQHQFELHRRYSRWLATVFSYLDRVYSKPRELKSVGDGAFNSFRVLAFDRVRDAAVDEALAIAERCRSGEASTEDAQLLRDFAQMLLAIGTERYDAYGQEFEREFVRSVRDRCRQARRSGASGTATPDETLAAEVAALQRWSAPERTRDLVEVTVLECWSD